ncbi:MAG: dihydrofolate reductase [Pseudonocardiaceae bacterium]|nr:dihydrofolate reductase [Pseudonocardiaceae bacterium]
MRKILYWVHSSLDGYINGPNGEFDWPAVGPELFEYSYGLNDRVDTFLYGRVVWDLMSGYWPHAESMSDDEHDLKFAPVWRATPKIVFSRTLGEAGWGARVINGNVADEVTALKQQPGKDLLLTGGSGLAATLTDLGLIDEYHITIHPVVLGGGKPLFPAPADCLNLRLTESRTFDGKSVLLRYEPAERDEQTGDDGR